jgi:hypothetical protein
MQFGGALQAKDDVAFQVLPLHAKLRLCLPAIANIIFAINSDAISTTRAFPDHHTFTPLYCPVCWGRHANRHICDTMVGMLQGGLEWMTDGVRLEVTETQCHARGDEHCVFRIEKP